MTADAKPLPAGTKFWYRFDSSVRVVEFEVLEVLGKSQSYRTRERGKPWVTETAPPSFLQAWHRGRLPDWLEDGEVKQAEIERLQKLVWGAVHNAGRGGPWRQRWAAVADALGVGSTTATALCVSHELDPEGMVGSEPECGCCGAKIGTPCDDNCDAMQ